MKLEFVGLWKNSHTSLKERYTMSSVLWACSWWQHLSFLVLLKSFRQYRKSFFKTSRWMPTNEINVLHLTSGFFFLFLSFLVSWKNSQFVAPLWLDAWGLCQSMWRILQQSDFPSATASRWFLAVWRRPIGDQPTCRQLKICSSICPQGSEAKTRGVISQPLRNLRKFNKLVDTRVN